MSPARSKRQPVPHRRTRAEIATAVGVGAGIVLVTAILVWLMRPGPAGTLATGGLMNRQPRASWLIGVAIGLASFATWWILRGSRRARAKAKVWLPVALGVVLAAAVGGGVAWPGGLLRHDVALTPQTTPPSTSTTKPGSSTTIGRTSTSVGSIAGGTGGTGTGPLTTPTAATTGTTTATPTTLSTPTTGSP